MSEKSVRLIENFVSWQGEGPDSGQTMIILRFKTCNLKCPWCDTRVKMRVSAEASHLLSDIQTTIDEKRAGILVTGGEPTVSSHFNEAVSLLNDLHYPVANVESNGFNLEELVKQTKQPQRVKFMYSPKIFSDKDVEKAMTLSVKLIEYYNVYFKIVFQDSQHVKKYCDLITTKTEGKSARNRIWLMPEGVTRADLIRNSEKVFDACEKYKFNFSSRDHLIYDFV